MNDLRLLLQADKDRKIINLQFKQINNLQLMMPILAKFQNLQSLSLNGNRLQFLPNDLAILQKLTEIDLSNNLFKQIDDVLPALKTLPKLTHLLYTFRGEQDELKVKRQLPRLERLNKKPLNNTSLVKKQVKTTATLKLNQKDLQQIAVIYDDIRDVYKRNKYFYDRQLAQQFDKGVDNIMSDLSSKLTAAGSDEDVNSSVVTCRYALIDLCFVKLITYFYHFDKNIASIMERIHDYIADAFRSMTEILKSSAQRTKTQIANVSIKKQELFKTQIKRLKLIQEHHLNQIAQLQQKNAQFLQKLTKNSKNNVLETTINNIIKRKNNKSPLKNNKPPGNGIINLQQIQSDASIKVTKSMTLHQLKEIIAEIYISKSKHNAICQDAGTPMQTLEGHMYTFLNQKYGLKAMTVQWAMSIVNGIKKYGPQDSQIAAFGKTLRNELQERFVQNMRRVKGNIRVAIRKFKGDDNGQITLHQSQQILLNCGYKRQVIDLIMSRVKKQNVVQGSISPVYLQQLALDHTLRKHCEKIRKVVFIFKQVDTDDDGVINQDQFYIFLQKMAMKNAVQLQQVLKVVDPFDTKVITLSHMLQIMQQHPDFREIFQ